MYLEIFFERALMWFPCFHHILELVLGAMIQVRWKMSGPWDVIYGRFKNEWPKLLKEMADILQVAHEKVDLVVPEDAIMRDLHRRVSDLLRHLVANGREMDAEGAVGGEMDEETLGIASLHLSLFCIF